MAFATAERIADDSFFNIEDDHIMGGGNEGRESVIGSVGQNIEEVSTRISDNQERIIESFFSKIGSFIEAGKEKIEEFSPGNIIQRAKGRVAEGASQFISNNPVSELIGSLKATFGGNKFETLHNDLVGAISQVKITESALESNREQLQRMALEGNESAEGLLEHLSNLERVDLYEKILDRQKLNSDEAALILNSLRNVANNIGEVEKELNVGLPDILSNFKNIISDQRVSEKSRREMLSDIQEYVKGLELSGDKVDQFLDVNVENFELNQENLSFVEDVFNEIKDDDIESAKLRFSLEEISNSLDRSVLDREELEGLLTREEGGETFEEKFLKNASLISAGKQISGGFGSALLGAVGLGALNQFGVGDMLGEFVGGKIGSTITKILPKIGSLLGIGGAGGLGGAGIMGTLKAGVGALGKIAAPLMLAKNLFDFGAGFLDAANISGIAEENLEFMDKVKSGIASFISGITFDLFIDPKETYDALFKTSWEDMKSMVDLFWKDVTGFFDEGAELLGFEPGAVSSKIKELAGMAFDSIMSPMEALWDAGKALFDETDARSFLDKAWDIAKGVFSIHPLSMLLDFATDLLGFDEGTITDKIKSIAESIFDFDPVGMLIDFGKNILGIGKEKKEEDKKKKEIGFFSGAKNVAGETYDFFFGDDEENNKGAVGDIRKKVTVGKLESQPLKIENIKEIETERRKLKQQIRREERQREEQRTIIMTPNIAEKEKDVLPTRVSVSDMDIAIINDFLFR